MTFTGIRKENWWDQENKRNGVAKTKNKMFSQGKKEIKDFIKLSTAGSEDIYNMSSMWNVFNQMWWF